jgi:hypothetical protein
VLRVPDVTTLYSLSSLICLAKVHTFDILWYKFWECENFVGCLVTFVTCCVWWRIKVVWEKVYRSLIWLKSKRAIQTLLNCFLYYYMFIWIQSVLFPISFVDHLQILFWLYGQCDVNPLKPTSQMMHQQFNIQQLYTLTIVFMCFVFIWEQTVTCATYSINWLVFITEMKSENSTVRTGSFNKVVCGSSLKGWVCGGPPQLGVWT